MSDVAAPNPPRIERPPVPVAATILTALVGVWMVLSLCVGGMVLAATSGSQSRVARSTARRADVARRRARIEDATRRLEIVAARLVSAARVAGELPETLDEAPPKDVWGLPIQYERTSPEHGVLRSAGPDGKFGTKDDVRLDVNAK